MNNPLVDAMNKGFETLTWAKRVFVMDNAYRYIDSRFDGQWVDALNKLPVIPCHACAIGAMMVALGKSKNEIFDLIKAHKKHPNQVMIMNDEAPNQATAVANITRYLNS